MDHATVDLPLAPDGAAAIGAALRRLRHGLGTTQAELARRSGIAQPVISSYERGARVPRADALLVLVHALGLAVTVAPDRPRPMAPELVARVLPDLLGLADAVPSRAVGPLAYPRLPDRPVSPLQLG